MINPGTLPREERNELIAQARAMRRAGVANCDIARNLDLPRKSVDRWLGGRRYATEASFRITAQVDGPTPEEEAARRAEMPIHDHRSLIGRIVGDPLPGRSALDQKLKGFA